MKRSLFLRNLAFLPAMVLVPPVLVPEEQEKDTTEELFKLFRSLCPIESRPTNYYQEGAEIKSVKYYFRAKLINNQIWLDGMGDEDKPSTCWINMEDPAHHHWSMEQRARDLFKWFMEDPVIIKGKRIQTQTI